jgi:N-carbamoylputrescine amidase
VATFTIGIIQDHAGTDLQENVRRAERLVRQAAARGAQIICLKELFSSPYFCKAQKSDRFDLAETVPGPTTDAMQKLARELEVVIVVPVFERQAAGVYRNSAAIIDADGSLMGVYRKMHIPDDPLFNEKYYFTPGDLGFKVHQTSRGHCGVLVCWDQWFPEAARLTALQGAQFLFYPTAIGWLPGEKTEMNLAQHSAWETAQRAHAIANGVFVVAVNRVGLEGQLQFWGQSFVADPFGRILAKASAEAEETLVVECDLSLIEQTRQNWPFLRDRRIDAYAPITQRLIER